MSRKPQLRKCNYSEIHTDDPESTQKFERSKRSEVRKLRAHTRIVYKEIRDIYLLKHIIE